MYTCVYTCIHIYIYICIYETSLKRADRGQYIQIKWQNIEDDWVAQYTVDGQTHQGEAAA